MIVGWHWSSVAFSLSCCAVKVTSDKCTHLHTQTHTLQGENRRCDLSSTVISRCCLQIRADSSLHISPGPESFCFLYKFDQTANIDFVFVSKHVWFQILHLLSPLFEFLFNIKKLPPTVDGLSANSSLDCFCDFWGGRSPNLFFCHSYKVCL